MLACFLPYALYVFYCAWEYKYKKAVTMDFYKYMCYGMKGNTPSYLNNWK